MHVCLLWLGRAGAALGVVLSLVAVFARLSGSYQLGTFQVLTLLQAGTAAMVMACLAYVASLAESPSLMPRSRHSG
jgi:hypothetical protein